MQLTMWKRAFICLCRLLIGLKMRDEDPEVMIKKKYTFKKCVSVCAPTFLLNSCHLIITSSEQKCLLGIYIQRVSEEE